MSNGGPAFPVPQVPATGQVKSVEFSGMTLRDYFAAAVLPALIERTDAASLRAPNVHEGFAIAAYTWADALIKVRGG